MVRVPGRWIILQNSSDNMTPKIIIGIVILAVLFFGFKFMTGGSNQQPPGNASRNIPSQGQQESASFDNKTAFYSKDGISLTHSWPGEGNFSAEETEILLFNESSSSVQVKSFEIEYLVEGKAYPQKSGTWEKFPSMTSWEKIEYLNISPQYYKGEPLILTLGQKGKLHWHINFGSTPLDGKQAIRVKLALLKDTKTIAIDEEFNRNSGTVVSKEEH